MGTLRDFFEGPRVRKTIRFLIYLFPGSTFFLLYLCRGAFRSHPLSDFSPDAYVFSGFTQYWLVYTLLQRLPRRWGLVLSPLVTLFFYVTIAVHNQSGNMLTSYFFMDRAYEATVVARYSGILLQIAAALAGYACFLLLYYFLKPRMDAFRGDYNLNNRIVQVLLAVVLVAQVFLPVPPSHLTYFISSGVKRGMLSRSLQNADLTGPEFPRETYSRPGYLYPLKQFPFVKIPEHQVPDDLRKAPQGPQTEERFLSFLKKNARAPVLPVQRPVFLLILESINGLYNYRESPEGDEYTPVMNRLGREGWTVPNFYATSSSSANGQFSVLCGILPSFLTQTSYGGWQNSFFCLPEILRRAGYHTVAYYDIEHPWFDNSEKFLKHLGFNEFHTKIGVDARKIKPTHHWSWSGDRPYYRNVFQHLKENPPAKTPFVLISVNENHWPFMTNSLGMSIEAAPTPEKKFQVIRESTHNADNALEVFMEELKRSPYGRDALVVIVGDHSYPWGQHSFFIAGDPFSEGTRTYFTVLGAGRRVLDHSVSQIDIAPTLVDILGIKVANHFQGISMLDRSVATRQNFFQSGSDTILTAIEFPYKYNYYFQSGRETMYDLKTDPDEKQPLSPDYPEYEKLMKQFRAQRQFLIFHQASLMQNRFWPGI